jgi:DNA (cytosine-5)-methyltransferase 1
VKYVSLFSGIGGLDLGLDRAGWKCAAQVERNPFRRTVLRRHWPEVPKHDDVRTFPRWWHERGAPPVDAVVGGFPCQPFSHSGKHLGVADERWGWPWFIDAVDVAGAEFILFENVRGLLRDAEAFRWILGDLSERGFDAEWSLVSACSVGAPHMRRRLFLVAHAAGSRWGGRGMAESLEATGWQEPTGGDRWDSDAGIRRVANGIPDRMERVTALGDAVVPRVAEVVGRAVIENMGPF